MQKLDFEGVVKNNPFISQKSEMEQAIFALVNCKTEEEFLAQAKALGEKYSFDVRVLSSNTCGNTYEFMTSAVSPKLSIPTYKLLPFVIFTYYKSKESSPKTSEEIVIDFIPEKNIIERFSVTRTYDGKLKTQYRNGLSIGESFDSMLSKISNRLLKYLRDEIYYHSENKINYKFLDSVLNSYSNILNVLLKKQSISFSFQVKDDKIIWDYASCPKEVSNALWKEVSVNNGIVTMLYLNGAVETYNQKFKTLLRKEPLVDGKQHCETGPAKALYKWDKEFISVEEHYFLNGKRFSSKEEWHTAVQAIKKPETPGFEAGLTTAAEVTTVNKSVTPTQNKKEKHTMSKILDTAKKDGREVAKRVVVTKAVDATATALAGLISPGTDKKAAGTRKSVEEALKTPAGKAFVSFIMGAAIPVVEAKIPEKYRGLAMEAGQEARVQGEVVIAEMIVDQLAKPAMKAALGGIQSSLDKVVEATESTEIRAELPATKATPELSEVNVEAAKASLGGKKKTE